MILLFIEAAARSLLVAAAVWAGLRIFRVSNVLAQKAAWGLVLVSAILMPLLLPISARLPDLPIGATVVIPSRLRAALPAAMDRGARPLPPPAESRARPIPQTSLATEDVPLAASRFPAPTISGPNSDVPAPAPRPGLVNPVRNLSWSDAIWMLYLAVSGVLIMRLLFGLAAALNVWQTAEPVAVEIAREIPLRSSRAIASPITIGSAVVLPDDYHTWDSEKLRIVLAHERSHIRQGDFYLQTLAGLYSALFWFSPLGWWVKRKLSDLGEAISDRAGLEEAASRSSYAQVLLEFAALPRPTLIGVAMARNGSLSHRIERLLNDTYFGDAFSDTRRRALVAVLLVPAALFATALIHVQAAGRVIPGEPATSAQSGLVPRGELRPNSAPMPTMESSAVRPNAHPAMMLSAGDATIYLAEGVSATQPAAPSSPVLSAVVAPAAVEPASTISFERTLSFSGQLQLSIATGSGNIHLTRGSANQVHIRGQVKVGREGSEEQARQIAANPPIEQNGNVIRVGGHQEQWHGISIDYEIEAPGDTALAAATGSGDLTDEGVGQNAKLSTGSGNINATGLQRGFMINTGSGNIHTEQMGEGDGKAQTGSGDIEIKDVHGGLYAMTGSGSIKATGTPSSAWKLETGSGNVEFWPGNAPLTLDASTGSGGVTSDKEMVMQGSLNSHHFIGKLNGGGPTVRIQTGSGDVRVH